MNTFIAFFMVRRANDKIDDISMLTQRTINSGKKISHFAILLKINITKYRTKDCPART